MSVESLLGRPLCVINLGLEVFAQELEADGVTVLHARDGSNRLRPVGAGRSTAERSAAEETDGVVSG